MATENKSLTDITTLVKTNLTKKLNKNDEAASVQWPNVKNKPLIISTINGVEPDSNGNVIIPTGGLPIGFEYFQTNPIIRAGSVPLTGGEYSRELYKDFWDWLQLQKGYLISEEQWQQKSVENQGAVPFYSSGDGSTTFRVPALTVWVKGTTKDQPIGSYYTDSLKSHNHDVTSVSSAGNHNHGASTNSAGDHTHILFIHKMMTITTLQEGDWVSRMMVALIGLHKEITMSDLQDLIVIP